MSQDTLILNHLSQGKTLTPLEALEKFGCFRLGSRIHELRHLGYNIINLWEERNGKKYAKYKLIPKEDLYDIPREIHT